MVAYDDYIRVRVTKEEKKQIKAKAKKQDKTLSAYSREALLNGKVVDYSELTKLTNQINKIGTNINQAAKIMNTYYDFTDNDFNYIVKEFDKLKKLIHDHIENK